MDNNEVKSQCVGGQDSVLQVSALESQCVGGQDSVLTDNEDLKSLGIVESKIKKMLEASKHQVNASECCIYRTPKILRKLNEAAYTPRLVSIGPFHHGNEELQPMQSFKYRYLQDYLNRTKKSIKELLTYIFGQKEKVKGYYAECIDPDASFVEMILLDGVFIIELLLHYYEYVATKNQEYVATKNQKPSDLSRIAKKYQNFLSHITKKNQKRYDLNQTSDVIIDLCCVLENQLPFFIIKGLYETGGMRNETGGVPNVPFWDLAILLCSDTITPKELLSEAEVDVMHFLDMKRRLILPPSMAPVSYTSLKTARISATVLHEAGVTFKVRKSRSFLDIKFANGKLEMPPFTFERSTETLIRNLMAYEQCHYGSETYLCDYFSLIDNLINTSKDVDLLVKNKIIINWLGDNDEVATLVNNLSKHVRFSYGQFYYSKLCEDLNDHCNYRWNKWLSALKHDYLSTPWKVGSTIAAIILLLLILIQTVCSIISLFDKK